MPPVCLEDGGFLALHRQCTHLGCTVPWVPARQAFVCPCHASAFDIRFVFNQWTLGEDFCTEVLKVPADKLDDFEFDLLTFLGFFGIHRFYMGKWGTGLIYLFTCGFFLIGVVYDFWTLNDQMTLVNRTSS